LIAIAVFGLVLAHGYDAALLKGMQAAGLPESVQQALELQRAKLAATAAPADLPAEQQAAVAALVKDAFISGYRWAMTAAGLMAYVSAVVALRYIRRAPAEDARIKSAHDVAG